MGTKRIVGFFDTEMVEAMKQRKASISNPVYERLQESGSVQVTNAQFYAFLKPFYEKIDGIGSIEDAFRVAGELKMAGARMLCNLSPIQEGDVLLSLDTRGPFDVYGGHRAFLESDQPDDVYSYLSTHKEAEAPPHSQSADRAARFFPGVSSLLQPAYRVLFAADFG